MKQETGIFIDKVNDKHVWLVYIHDGIAIYRQPLAQAFRDHLESFQEADARSGQIAKGFQPETAFEKLRLSKAVTKEIDIA